MAISSERLATAVLSNLDSWLAAIEEIHENAAPGNKVRALHLARNMLQAKMALQRIIDEG